MSYFVFQGNDSDCGFASLKMLLAILSKQKNYLYLKKTGIKRKHYTFFELTEIAKKYNLGLVSYEVDFDGFTQIKTPFLAMLNGNHIVVVKKISKNVVIVLDPEIGKRRIKKKEFKKLFSKLVLEPQDYRAICPCNSKKETIIPFYRNIVQYVSSIIIGASLMLGFYYLKDETSFILLIIFLLVVVVSELVENWYLIKNIKYFDKKFLPQYFDDPDNRNLDQYCRYNEFKKSYFESSKSIAISLIFIFVVSTLLVMNDFKNLLVLAIILVITVVDKVAFEGKENEAINYIDSLEKNAFGTRKETIKNLTLASNKAITVASMISARKCVKTFLVAVLAMLMMVMSGTISTNYVLFHFGAYYVVSNSFGLIVNYLSNYKKLKKEEARFFDSCNL